MSELPFIPVAIYARVSSERQDIDNSVAAQLRLLREYARRNGLLVAAEYVDEAKSGRVVDRPNFGRMIAAAESPEPPFREIIVWKFNRFFRNRMQSIIYKSLIREKGIEVTSINEPVENTPAGRMFEGILESIAQYESENLAVEVRRGMEEAALRGEYLAAIPPYGYKRIKVPYGRREHVTLEVDEECVETVQEIFRLCRNGVGLKDICKHLNHLGIPNGRGRRWDINYVRRLLTNSAYIGTAEWGKTRNGLPAEPIVCPGAWEAIISPEDFKDANAALTSRQPAAMLPAVAGSPRLLSGLLRCAYCGMAYQSEPAKGGLYAYYLCGTVKRQGAGSCEGQRLNAEDVGDMLISNILTEVLQDNFLEQCLTWARKNYESWRREVVAVSAVLEAEQLDVNRRLQKLYDALESEDLDLRDLAPRIKELTDRRAELEAYLAEVNEYLSDAAPLLASPAEIRDNLLGLDTFLKGADPQTARPFMHALIEQITVSYEELEVAYLIPVS